MATNGTITTKEDLLRSGELGSAIEYGRLFVSYEEGRVFTPMDFTPQRVDEMLGRDGKARTLEQVLTLPLRAAEWSIEKPVGDKGQTDFVRKALTDPPEQGGMAIPLQLVLAQMTAALLYRRAYFEKVYKVQDGQVAYDKIAWRPPGQCRLEYDRDTGEFAGIAQQILFPEGNKNVDPDGYVRIPPQRAFVHVHNAHRRPLEGESDLQTALAIYEVKQKIKFLWAAFLENQSTPKAIAKHGDDDSAQIQAFAKKVATIKGGGVVGIGPDQDVQPFQSNSNGASQFEAMIAYLDQEMAGSVLAGFTDLTRSQMGGRGSFALSKDATDMFLQSCEAKLREEEAQFTNQVIAPLVRWNFGVSAAVPSLKFGPLVREAEESAVDLFKGMATAQQVNPNVPSVFLEMLVSKVSTYLDLDEERLDDAFKQMGQNQTPLNQLQSGVNAATHLVMQAGLAPQPTPQPTTPPTTTGGVEQALAGG